ETRTLARLQHNHIVPIYSVHRTDDLDAICMPFLGATTLADILRDLRGRDALPTSGKYLLERVEARARSRDAAWVAPGSGRGGPEIPELPIAYDKMNYVNAILSLAARPASGLAHAPGRDILHRAVKPANILLTDNAQPMLLDFNLAEVAAEPQNYAKTRAG